MDDERPNCTIPEQHEALEKIEEERHGHGHGHGHGQVSDDPNGCALPPVN